MRHIYLFWIFLYFCIQASSAQNQSSNHLDSIFKLRELSSNEKLSDTLRIVYANRALEFSRIIGNDTTVLKSGRNLALLYDKVGSVQLWQKQNKKNLLLARNIPDTLALAVANLNIGLAKQYYDIQYDSAYYYYTNALKYYDVVGSTDIIASIYLYIAEIQNTEKVYVSSEENAIKAIKLFNSLPKTESVLDDLWSLNNLLGNVSFNMGRYSESLEYHTKAINIANDMNDGIYNKTISFNNQANGHRKLGNYDKSLALYDRLINLKEEYDQYDETFYPLIINNLAYTKILAGHKDYDTISDMFYEAYSLSESLNDDVTKLVVTIDLSKFYKHLRRKDSTLKYAKKSYDLAKRISSNDILFESMVLLSELKEGEEGKAYLYKHIKLTDSLLNVERNVRNKFARIELETDQIEAENEQISKENLYLVILSAGLLLTAILIYLVIAQRAKNRKLKLIQVQQKANEDIYNLMLAQQDQVDEARAKEKTRVSKELHDGVLGRLFGTRLSLDSINFKDGKEAMMARANYIGQLKIIEEDIRKISHELNADFVSGSEFMDIVTELIENQTQAYDLKYHFDYTDDIYWDLVSNKIKINIYRIVQESMQNIYKHANAKAIKISISLQKEVICIDIIDDGDGFDTTKSKKGIGLINMTSRVEDVDGKIAFISQSGGGGTTVNVKIPYTN
jgi:signal transduction histidine kinase